MRRILPLFVSIGLASCAYVDDLVPSIPGMGNMTDFPLYSGYLSVRGSGKYLHYMLAESQKTPITDPLVIWFNGGPGCSSMLGFLQEHGPYVMEDDTNYFHKNDYSWNREVNMLYIESPAGVGFSFCEDREQCNFDDNSSANDNLDALQSFFAKFPEYRNNDLYISGESYAGVYVPYLALKIDEYNAKLSGAEENALRFNLKGILVGNGVTNWKWDGDTTYVEMAKYHGIYGPAIWDEMTKNNCNYYYEDNNPEDSEICTELYNQFQTLVIPVNVYDIYRKCYAPGLAPDGKKLQQENFIGKVEVGDEVKTYRRVYSSLDYTPWVHKKYDSEGKLLGYNDLPPCTFGIPIIDWINTPEVRKALHIPDEVQAWDLCTDNIGYDSLPQASEWIYPKLQNKYRILFYSGSTDGAVPTRGSRLWISTMNWKVQKEYRPYFVNNLLGGFIEEREGLTFGTIHGVGHMAPQWKREETYYLIFNWLFNKDI